MTGIGPEDRLDEAIKQIEIVRDDVDMPKLHELALQDAIDDVLEVKHDFKEFRNG